LDLPPEYREIDHRVEQQDWKNEQTFSPEHERKTRFRRCRVLDRNGKGDDIWPERDRERVPLDWAATEQNLGVALWVLGERESGTERLEKAIAAYLEALQERTRERVPLDWAMSQQNLGNALWSLGERESGTDRLEQAVAARGCCPGS
jgi:hypothetical protein